MDILRITTAGSVDDGKSTLIGRLLYDTNSITKDKLEALEAASKRKGLNFTDLSLLTDGLIAEREQGITIDVAYIYFSTPSRKYIIADSPGHAEYTRNMITGASTASVFIILIDARQGITEQTRRHFYIASLLRIKEVIVCINKMDLVDYTETIYDKVQNDFQDIIDKIGFDEQQVHFIPVAAKDGDNVVYPSQAMEWYNGPSLLEYLEALSFEKETAQLPARFPVQYVIRPQEDKYHDFRGYAGRLVSGSLKEGDEVMVLPSQRSSKIKSIVRGETYVKETAGNESVIITLDDDIDVSRGNMLVKATENIDQLVTIKATICWMTDAILTTGKMYLLQHGINRIKVKVTAVGAVLDIRTLETAQGKHRFELNDIGEITLKAASPLFADIYEHNPANGNFILIDEFSNNTVAVGIIKG
ncbi:MAG: sulfate adenylyltransferase [Chitinophagaceae bacterium]|nr:sulfate adenylyltransferase [Chitinophagaceae bacterium]